MLNHICCAMSEDEEEFSSIFSDEDARSDAYDDLQHLCFCFCIFHTKLLYILTPRAFKGLIPDCAQVKFWRATVTKYIFE